ncbi:MAG: Na+/H+ antiporter NhaC family protein [Lentisphaeria bacterium]|nr:Na+/H+ antiporter NhaC family protein [Lentisphaeria bacterium]
MYVTKTPKSSFAALIPFLVFLVFYLGLSIWAKDFYCVPMPIAFIVASAVALWQNKRQKLAEKVEIYARGMGESNIMIMCLIFVLAGAFAAVAKGAGSVDAAVRISRHLIPESLILPEFFFIGCFISLAIGTSCGTIAALTPIAAGITSVLNIPPELMIGAVIGGAMFGDNMSMISDTTIAATRTQNVAMRDKFIMNFKMILPAALITFGLYFFAGMNIQGGGEVPSSSWLDLILIAPYILILAGALLNFNVMALLFAGTLMTMMIGIFTGNLEFWKGLAIAGEGVLGMAETLIVAILAGGLLCIIKYNGGINYLMSKIEKAISSKYGCEFGIMLLVGAINLFTANNTVAIVIAGPIAKELGNKYKCDPRRIASILDTASCVVQGLIPYGAQILIAIGIARGAGLKISSLSLIGTLYYPMLLGVSLILSIVIAKVLSRRKSR